MIRVMEVLSDSNLGGAGIWVRNYASGYSSERIQLSVLLPRGAALAPLLADTGCEVIECDMTPDQSLDAHSVREIGRQIRSWRPQIVHTHGSLSGRIAAKRAGVYTIYTNLTLSPVSHGIRRAIRGGLDNLLADRIIACSACAKENLIANGVRAEKIEIVYNGCARAPVYCDSERGARRTALGLSPEDFVFGIVARLAPIKDHDTLLRAAARAELPEGAKLLIVGGGELEKPLKQRAEELGIVKRCIFTGQLPGAAEIYPLIDVNILCSLSENMPISLVESMAADKPSIASRVGGMEEVAVDGETALLFEAGDDAALAAHMERLSREPELCRALGAAGRRRFEQKFTLEKCVADTEKIYSKIGGCQHGE